MPASSYEVVTGDGSRAAAAGTLQTVTEASPIRSQRQRRFEELLRAGTQMEPSTSTSVAPPKPVAPPPQPVATPAAPLKAQSVMSRLLAPIVNAIGGGSGNTGAPAAAPQPARDRTPAQPAKDPTSDATPPQLTGLQFDPPSIQDGQTTTLTVLATDDLSGVRSISGSVTSPTGKALQGFAMQPAGEPNRFVAQIAVPKDAEEGMWHINFLSLSDNASNTQNLNFSQGTLPPTSQFRVASARPDSTPPVLKAIWLDKPSINNGEKVTIFIRAEDDKSGVNLVSGVFQSPSKFARIGFGCRQTDDSWQCEMTPPKCIDCGSWQLEQVQMQDKANNMATIRMDNPLVGAVKLGVSGDSCDATPPAMQNFVLDQTSVSNADAATINVMASVSDDQCGVSSVSGQAAGPPSAGGQPPRIYFSFRPSSDGQWTAQLLIPKLAAKGVWSIVWVQLLDKGNNLKTYSQSDNVLGHAQFTVR